MAGVAQVEGGLGDADVGLDADEGDAGLRLELGGDGGDEHGEFGLVVGRGGEEVGDGGDGCAELCGGLGCCVDGDGEGLGVGEEFDGGGDNAVEFVNDVAELVLHVTDEDGRVLEPQFRGGGHFEGR